MTPDDILAIFGNVRELVKFGRDSADVFEYLLIGKPGQKEEQEIIEWNWFLRHSATINLYASILTLSKLFPHPSYNSVENNHFSFRAIISKLKRESVLTDDHVKNIEVFLTELEGRPAENKSISKTKLLNIWRDKVIAHTDKKRHEYFREIGISVQIIQELYTDAERIANGLLECAIGTGIDYSSFRDLKGELEKLVLPAAKELKSTI